MIAWQTVAILAGLFTALGTAFDRLLSVRWKARVHLKLVHWWNQLDETRIPDLLPRIATYIINRLDHFAKGKRHLVLLYFAATCVFLFIGTLGVGLDKDATDSVEVPMANVGHSDIFDDIRLPHVLAFIVVFVFDLAILLMTTAVLRRIKFGSGLRNFGFLTFHFGVTIMMLCGCFAAAQTAHDFAFNHSMLGMRYERRWRQAAEPNIYNYMLTNNAKLRAEAKTNAFMNPLGTNTIVKQWKIVDSYLSRLQKTPTVFWDVIRNGHGKWSRTYRIAMVDGIETVSYERLDSYELSKSAFFLTGTMCIPALALIGFLMVLLIAKFVLNTSRATLMYFLDLTTEPNPKEFAPGALTGVVFSVFVALANCAIDLLKLITNIVR